jgi:hypothetical protein
VNWRRLGLALGFGLAAGAYWYLMPDSGAPGGAPSFGDAGPPPVPIPWYASWAAVELYEQRRRLRRA